MPLELPTLLKPFDMTDRPGGARGAAPTALSAMDLSGIIYRQVAKKDGVPAVSTPVTDLPGVAGIANGVAVDPAKARHDALHAQAAQLVNQTFFGTMLRQMRESPFKSDLFSGGKGGQAFSQLYDQKLVEQMSRGSGKKLINAVVRKFEAKKAYAAAPAEAGAAMANQSASLKDPPGGRMPARTDVPKMPVQGK